MLFIDSFLLSVNVTVITLILVLLSPTVLRPGVSELVLVYIFVLMLIKKCLIYIQYYT